MPLLFLQAGPDGCGSFQKKLRHSRVVSLGLEAHGDSLALRPQRETQETSMAVSLRLPPLKDIWKVKAGCDGWMLNILQSTEQV
jgi:hypothetical protein